MENEPVTVKKIIEDFRQSLAMNYEPKEADQLAFLLFEEWKGWSRADVHLNRNEILTEDESAKFYKALGELKENKPVQYIIGAMHFLNVKIKVSAGVLIPRPETEELVAMILRDYQHRQFENLSLLDIGTGSGCIPVSIKKGMPGWDISATDISTLALQIASGNATLNQCPVNFIQADIFDKETWKNFPGYTIIVSNPPYVTLKERSSLHPNVVAFEPHEALFVGNEDPLLFFRAIAEFAYLHLVRPGSLYLEINEKFGTAVRDLLIAKGFDRASVMRDIHGKERFVLAEAKTTMKDTSYWNVEH